MDISKNRNIILGGSLWKAVFTLAIPVMATNFIQTIYGLVDTYFIAKLGTSQVASVQLSFPITFLLLSLGMGMSIAATSMIAQYSGQKNMLGAKKIASQILIVNVILSVALGILGIICLKPLMMLLGVSGDLFQYTYDYLFVNFLGLPTMFLMFAYNGIKNGSGDTVSPMILNTVGVIVTIILDPIFIFTLNMGVAGGAWAMVVSRGIFSAYAIYRMFTVPQEMQLHLSDLKPDWADIKTIFKIGLPSSFGSAMEAIGFLVMNLFIVDMGVVTLTAFSIGNRVNGLILMPALGIGGALATIIGQNLGAGQVDRARQAVKMSTILATLILTIGGIPMIIFATPVIAFFSQDPLVIAQGSYYLILITLSIPLMGIFSIFTGTFQGSGHTFMTMFMQLGRLWALRIPLIVLLKSLMPGDPNAIWYSMIISNLLTCLFGYILYKTDRWTIPVIKNKAAEILPPEERV